MTAPEKPRAPKAPPPRTTVPVSAGRAALAEVVRGDRLDLLAAALIGAAVGAAAALLSAGPTRRPIVRGVQRGVRQGARRSAELGAAALDRVPGRDAAAAVREYVESARGAIDSAVEQELRDLRRAVRRQRKRIGV